LVLVFNGSTLMKQSFMLSPFLLETGKQIHLLCVKTKELSQQSVFTPLDKLIKLSITEPGDRAEWTYSTGNEIYFLFFDIFYIQYKAEMYFLSGSWHRLSQKAAFIIVFLSFLVILIFSLLLTVCSQIYCLH